MEKGYYWIYFRIHPEYRTVGYYEGEIHDDGSINSMPWQVVGSDEIFRNDQIEVIEKVKKCHIKENMS